MNSLLTDIWRCVNIANEKGEDIQIHLHPQTIEKLNLANDEYITKPPFSVVKEGSATLFGKEIVMDEDIVIDSFVIQRVIRLI